MDKLTVLGLIFAITAIFLGQVLDGGKLQVLFNMPALIIVLGGTMGAVMVQTPFRVFKSAFFLLPWIIFPPKNQSLLLVEEVVSWSRLARQNGLLSLEPKIKNLDNPIAKQGLELLLAGIEKETIRKVLETEVDNKEVYQRQAANVFESMGGYSPTIGIMGAVLGLIQVMRNLTDPSELGMGIAVAFVATIYGVGFANLLFLPIANKLKFCVYEQIREAEMLVEGVMALAEGDNPKRIEMKMMSFCQSQY